MPLITQQYDDRKMKIKDKNDKIKQKFKLCERKFRRTFKFKGLAQ